MFIYFDCGCYGINIKNSKGKYLILSECGGDQGRDGHPYAYHFNWKDMESHTFNYFDEKKQTEILEQLNSFMIKAERWMEFKRLIHAPDKYRNAPK